MRIAFEWNDRQFSADTQTVFDLSTPIDFGGVQPTFFGLPRAAQEAIQGGGFIGDTEQGGACNCRQSPFVPTVTELILKPYNTSERRRRRPPRSWTKSSSAHLISVDTTTLAQSEESYSKWGEPDDR